MSSTELVRSGPQVAADLRAAADIIERDGWTQHSYREGAARCLVGAIEDVTGVWMTSDYDPAAMFRKRAAYGAVAQVLGTGPISWNDRQHLTANEVVATLRDAADVAQVQWEQNCGYADARYVVDARRRFEQRRTERVSLADLYSGDRRGAAAELAERTPIPHPLHGVEYGNGADRCTHAKWCTTPTGKAAAR